MRLLKQGLLRRQVDDDKTSEPPLHIRRTLDQSHFLNLKDTSHRDQDQVVYRATKLPWYEPGNLARVVMVDQLWMWLLDDRMSSFPIPTCSDFFANENYESKVLTGGLSARYDPDSISKTVGTQQAGLFWYTQELAGET